MNIKSLLDKAVEIAVTAGAIILEVYHSDNFQVERKEDDTPVTKADCLADDYIWKQLQQTEIPIISEESEIPSYTERKKWERFWLVDPLDGTKEFVNRNGEFTVNIALIENGVPLLGVVFAPVLGELYCGIVGQGAYKIIVEDGKVGLPEEIPYVEYAENEEIVFVTSRSFSDLETMTFIENFEGEKSLVTVGSSLKFCLVATGEATYYPRLLSLKEWDIAAGVAVVLASGGSVETLEEGAELKFNKENLQTDFFIAKNPFV